MKRIRTCNDVGFLRFIINNVSENDFGNAKEHVQQTVGALFYVSALNANDEASAASIKRNQRDFHRNADKQHRLASLPFQSLANHALHNILLVQRF